MRLVFAGTSAFAERALAGLLAAGHQVVLVLTRPDRPAGRGLQAHESPVKRLARGAGIEVFQPPNFRDPADVTRVCAAQPDALVVAAYGLLLPPAVLGAGRHGALNIHASLLPRWRGAAPIHRALLAGDAQTGISIMQMDAGLDTGPVLAQVSTPIEPDDDSGTLEDRLADLGAQALLDTLPRVASGAAQAVPQPAEGVTYARKIEKTEAQLDWTRPAVELERVIRAFRPAPGAATRLGSDPLKIWRARMASAQLPAGKVGAGLVVGCGEGALQILELQRAGGKRLAAAEFMRGYRLPADACLG